MQINQRVLSGAVSWLLQHQGPQGEFQEVGRVIHTEVQGGLDTGSVALTAYVLMALLEDESYVVSRGGSHNRNSAQCAQCVRFSFSDFVNLNMHTDFLFHFMLTDTFKYYTLGLQKRRGD